MRIVLVDGDASHLRSLEILLTERGHVVSAFHDVRSACAALQSEQSRPEALILERPMWARAASAVRARFRERLPQDCRVILIGDVDPGSTAEPPALRAAVVLPKPLDFAVLRRVLE